MMARMPIAIGTGLRFVGSVMGAAVVVTMTGGTVGAVVGGVTVMVGSGVVTTVTIRVDEAVVGGVVRGKRFAPTCN
jgi:hypothetical protein